MATHLTGHPSAGPLSGTYKLGVAGLGDTAIAGNNAYNDKFNDNGKGSEGNDSDDSNQTALDKFVSKNISGPLSKQVGDLTNFINNHPLVKFLDSTIGEVFGGHPGQTYWESKAPPPTSEYYAAYEKANPRPITDQFTYQRTASEVAAGVKADDARNRVLSYSGNSNSTNSNVATRTDSEGNTREVGRYTNTTPQRGSNTAAYGDNYLKAIPDSYKINNLYKQVLGREAGPAGLNFYGPKLADGSMSESQLKATLLASNEYKNSGASASAPLSAPITSPSASNSVATSYGNSNNAGRQWTSGVFANNNGGVYAGGGDTGVDITKNGTTLNGLYQEVFGRDVGPDGIAAYQSALDNKTMTPEQVRAILMASVEKTNQLATGNTAAVVTAPLDVNDSVSLSTDTNTTNLASNSGTGSDFRYTAEDGSVFSYDPSTGTPTLVTGPLNTSSAVLSDEDQLRQYYKTYLGREIGDAGLTGYTNMLADGSKNMSDIKADLAYVKSQGGESAIASQAATTGGAA